MDSVFIKVFHVLFLSSIWVVPRVVVELITIQVEVGRGCKSAPAAIPSASIIYKLQIWQIDPCSKTKPLLVHSNQSMLTRLRRFDTWDKVEEQFMQTEKNMNIGFDISPLYSIVQLVYCSTHSEDSPKLFSSSKSCNNLVECYYVASLMQLGGRLPRFARNCSTW